MALLPSLSSQVTPHLAPKRNGEDDGFRVSYSAFDANVELQDENAELHEEKAELQDEKGELQAINSILRREPRSFPLKRTARPPAIVLSAST